MNDFVAYADGSCLGNPGPGGWAVLISVGNDEVKHGGKAPATTNNIMEIVAVTEALGIIPEEWAGVIKTDSNYVVQGITAWRKGWVSRGWRNAQGKAVANKDLWIALFALVDSHPKVTYQWVKGHASDEQNNRVDEIARSYAMSAKVAR